MINQTKNTMIALFVIAASAIVIFILLFLHPQMGDEGRILRVRFADIDKISIGTRVTYAGKPVGEVISIRELPSAEKGRAAYEGYVYVYELELAVDSSVNVFNTDEIMLRTAGLLGEKSVAILPRPPEEGERAIIVSKKVIYATEAGTVEEAFKEFKKLSDLAEETLTGINKTLARVEEEKVVKNIADSFRNVNEILTSVNKPEQLAAIIDNIEQVTGKINQSWGDVDNALRDVSALARSLNQAADKLANGEGTLGKLFMDDDLYLRLTSVMNKAEITMNDVNHYGLLFHLDKGWQRLRARRLNLLQKLRSPQEFRNYFNDEIDKVTTSLSRVSMVMQKTTNQPCCPLLDDYEFRKVFSELLRRIEGVEEDLKMYNQQLVTECEE